MGKQITYDITLSVAETWLFMKSSYVISSEQLGKAMIKVARDGYFKPHIESSELKKI